MIKFKDHWYKVSRVGGLRRFAVAITLFNVLGHAVFGFEQSIAQPLIALAVAYGMSLVIEWHLARLQGRSPRFTESMQALIDFLLPAHITALAVAMLIYTNDRLWPVAFATAVAIGSKSIFRAPVGRGSRHIFNPSNIGITAVLLCFHWVSIAPPYHFTENLTGIGDWILPAIIVCSGTYLNARFTRKLPLIAAWLGGFGLQALFRSLLFGTPIAAALMPMTGVAFVLYTFYMVTDPATTPSDPFQQVVFGGSVAAAYAMLMVFHVVFGLFFALSIVCALRGFILTARAVAVRKAPGGLPEPLPAARPPIRIGRVVQTYVTNADDPQENQPR